MTLLFDQSSLHRATKSAVFERFHCSQPIDILCFKVVDDLEAGIHERLGMGLYGFPVHINRSAFSNLSLLLPVLR